MRRYRTVGLSTSPSATRPGTGASQGRGLERWQPQRRLQYLSRVERAIKEAISLVLKGLQQHNNCLQMMPRYGVRLRPASYLPCGRVAPLTARKLPGEPNNVASTWTHKGFQRSREFAVVGGVGRGDTEAHGRQMFPLEDGSGTGALYTWNTNWFMY